MTRNPLSLASTRINLTQIHTYIRVGYITPTGFSGQPNWIKFRERNVVLLLNTILMLNIIIQTNLQQSVSLFQKFFNHW